MCVCKLQKKNKTQKMQKIRSCTNNRQGISNQCCINAPLKPKSELNTTY